MSQGSVAMKRCTILICPRTHHRPAFLVTLHPCGKLSSAQSSPTHQIPCSAQAVLTPSAVFLSKAQSGRLVEIQAHWSLSLEPPSGAPRAFLRGETTSLAGCHGNCIAVVSIWIGDVCCPPTPSWALQTGARLLILPLPAARKTFDME